MALFASLINTLPDLMMVLMCVVAFFLAIGAAYVSYRVTECLIKQVSPLRLAAGITLFTAMFCMSIFCK